MRTKLKRMSLAAFLTVSMLLGSFVVANPVSAKERQEAGGVCTEARSASYTYNAQEACHIWNGSHRTKLTGSQAAFLAAYLNAIVEYQIGQYLLAIYLNAVSASQTCNSPSTCATLIRSVFSSYGLDGNAAVRVATCESGLNPRATNGSHDGLFQQARQYWAARANQYGMQGRSAYDPYANTVVSAGMVRDTGGWSHWSCRP